MAQEAQGVGQREGIHAGGGRAGQAWSLSAGFCLGSGMVPKPGAKQTEAFLSRSFGWAEGLPRAEGHSNTKGGLGVAAESLVLSQKTRVQILTLWAECSFAGRRPSLDLQYLVVAVRSDP